MFRQGVSPMPYQEYEGGYTYLEAPQAPMQHMEEDSFDEAAFEQAFEHARAEIEMQEGDLRQEHVEMGQDVLLTDSVHDLPSAEDVEQLKIGSDAIPYNESEEWKDHVNDADELAKTAGQLLDSVSHDQSQKFKNSSFLELMRRIRDREVQVDGDEFRDVSTLL